MNTADLCAEGRELFAQWRAWHERAFATYLAKYDQQRIRAWQQYRNHYEECDECQDGRLSQTQISRK